MATLWLLLLAFFWGAYIEPFSQLISLQCKFYVIDLYTHQVCLTSWLTRAIYGLSICRELMDIYEGTCSDTSTHDTYNGRISLSITHVTDVQHKVHFIQFLLYPGCSVHWRIEQLFPIAAIFFPTAHVCTQMLSRWWRREGVRMILWQNKYWVGQESAKGRQEVENTRHEN